MKKMNNKGFSLVELIVVVLIMAIIAVALAPQVMKWVEKSRLSADRETYDNLIANVQLALTDKNTGNTVDGPITFTIDNSGSSITAGDGDSKVANALALVNASWADGKAKRSSATYTFTVSADKQITRGAGTADPSKVADTDLD